MRKLNVGKHTYLHIHTNMYTDHFQCKFYVNELFYNQMFYMLSKRKQDITIIPLFSRDIFAK